jgi:hypothetical protein
MNLLAEHAVYRFRKNQTEDSHPHIKAAVEWRTRTQAGLHVNYALLSDWNKTCNVQSHVSKTRECQTSLKSIWRTSSVLDDYSWTGTNDPETRTKGLGLMPVTLAYA